MNDTFRTFTWDAESNPVTIGPVSLTYDALDRMVEQSVSGTNSEIVYSPTGVKLALMNGTTLTKAFVPLTGGATAVYNSSGLAYYRHSDHLGSSRFASTPTRTLYSDTAYSPYGEPYASSGSIDNSFTGQNQDTTAGLYDFLFREQDPNQSRWTSPDPSGLAAVNPANPQSWNRYAYVRNMPLVLTDPFGLCPPVVQNRDSSDSQDTKSGGPSPTDSGDPAEADPQGVAGGGSCQSAPWYFTLGGGGGDGALGGGIGGGGVSIDGGGAFSPGDGTWGLTGIGNVGNNALAGGSGVLWVWTPGGTVSSAAGTADYPGYFTLITLPGFNSADDSGGGNSSWAWTFTKSFFTFAGGPGNVPTCAGQTIRQIGSELLGGSADSQAAETSLKAAATYKTAKAIQYAAGRTNTFGGVGLICPACSSVFRSIMSKAEFLGEASEAVPVAEVSYEAAASIPGVAAQARNGSCAAAFPIF